jgi:hypothetical protein
VLKVLKAAAARPCPLLHNLHTSSPVLMTSPTHTYSVLPRASPAPPKAALIKVVLLLGSRALMISGGGSCIYSC